MTTNAKHCRLRAENKRLREVNEVLKLATIFFAGDLDPPKPLIVAFVDQMKAVGHAVESILIALNTVGLKIAPRTLRAWCAPAVGVNGPAARTMSDALVEDVVRQRLSSPMPPGNVCWLRKGSMAGARCWPTSAALAFPRPGSGPGTTGTSS
ncbi:hypothetical protein [Streptomyces zaomyceticus]|uniref:hypothetical protein n=1 Tax=Streptomyces zaomyceticus TaxID=68286 RepID=UPI0036AF2E35